jgi:antitoxin VapB
MIRVTAKAKLFMSGRSQAVRLPKEFRFPGAEVKITRVGSGVLLEPAVKTWDEVFAEIDAIKGSPIKRPKQPKPAKRLPIR